MGSSAKSSSLQTINHDEIRGRCCSLLPWQLRLMLMLTPTTPMATATATTWATTMVMALPTDTTTARGLPMPSPLLMPMPTTVATLATPLLWLLPPLCPPSTEVPFTDSPMAVSTATTTARGPLMPSPLL